MSVTKKSKNTPKSCKKELVDAVYETVDCNRFVVQDIIDSFLGQLKDTLAKGNTVELRGFGTFSLKYKRARPNARNPRTGEVAIAKPHRVVSFKAGGILKQMVYDIPAENE